VSNGENPRSSIFSGVLLILLGVLFLLHRFHPELRIGHLIGIYWPVLLILWGVAKLIDHLAATRTGHAGQGVLSGGEAGLLFLVILALFGLWIFDKVVPPRRNWNFNFDPFAERYTESQEVPPATLPAGANLTVQTRAGNINVHTGGGNELHVEANKSASGSSESRAHKRMEDVAVTFEKNGSGYLLHPSHQEDLRGRVNVDLDVEVPKKVNLTALTSHGDISISGISGGVTATTESGDVEIHDVGSDVSVDLKKGDARISNVSGSVRVTGKGSQIDIDDVAGDATLEGDFFGPVRVRNVTKTTHYASQRSDITLQRLSGRLELDSGDIEISDVGGAAKIAAHEQDIEAENIAGRLDIIDTKGDIKVRLADPPREEINIADDSGEVDITLPAKSGFEINAVSRSGEVESDFEDASLRLVNGSDTGRLNGKVGSRGPKINITTSYGTIYLRRSD
jgi:DUF4097 and DUF4098 domain-containing protein YvlB